MAFDSAVVLAAVAVAANGVLTGASLDQSIKQLPARRKIGALAFSAYSRAADLGPGVAWYATIGIGAAVLTIAAAIVVALSAMALPVAWPVYAAAVLSVAHSLATARAAPINFSQRRVLDDEQRLAEVFNRFERWQTLRVILQSLTFALALIGLVAIAAR